MTSSSYLSSESSITSKPKIWKQWRGAPAREGGHGLHLLANVGSAEMIDLTSKSSTSRHTPALSRPPDTSRRRKAPSDHLEPMPSSSSDSLVVLTKLFDFLFRLRDERVGMRWKQKE